MPLIKQWLLIYLTGVLDQSYSSMRNNLTVALPDKETERETRLRRVGIGQRVCS